MPEYIRLIEAQECIKDYLKELIDEGKDNVEITEFNAEIQKRLAEGSATDVVEAKHGAWIKKPRISNEYKQCSICKYDFSRLEPDSYCPKCGAIMDLKEGAEE